MLKNLSRRHLLAGSAVIGAGTLAGRRVNAQAANTVRIGFTAPLSGALASVGNPIRLGAEIARDEVNAKGGILGRKLELVILDDRGDSSQAVANMREFAGGGIKQVVGTPMTATAMASTAVLRELGISLASTGTPDERLTHELYNANYFQGAENTFTRCMAFAEMCAQRYPDVTSWTAALMDATVGRDYWERAKHAFTTVYKNRLNKDVKFFDPVSLKLGGNDFKPQISQLMTTPADGLFVVMPGAGGITMYQQGQAFGLAKKFKLLTDHSLDIDLAKALKQQTPTNCWISSYWYPDAFKQYKESVDLAREITARSGELPHGFSSLAHINVHGYAAAIAIAGSTETDKVTAALGGLKMDTCKGPGYFRKEDHQFIAGTCFFTVKPREAAPGFETGEVFALNTSDFVNPPAPGVVWKL